LIIEPVAANMGLIPPVSGFLEGLRAFTKERGILLIFDEVISGFRLCYGGVQKLYDLKPDLTCLGKIVGGGMPLAAYGGTAAIMQKIAPLGPVYQAGTLSGNPVASAAGLAALQLLREQNYASLQQRTEMLLVPIRDRIRKASLPVSISQLGSMFTLFFRPDLPKDFAEAKQSDTKAYAKFFWGLLERGIYTACSQFETNFIGFAHTDEDLSKAQSAYLELLTK